MATCDADSGGSDFFVYEVASDDHMRKCYVDGKDIIIIQ